MARSIETPTPARSINARQGFSFSLSLDLLTLLVALAIYLHFFRD